jgi:hypothetical protein
MKASTTHRKRRAQMENEEVNGTEDWPPVTAEELPLPMNKTTIPGFEGEFWHTNLMG